MDRPQIHSCLRYYGRSSSCSDCTSYVLHLSGPAIITHIFFYSGVVPGSHYIQLHRLPEYLNPLHHTCLML